jgi:hypothetical protein
VELKYTRDNAPEEAADKAEQQNAELVKALQTHNANCNVKLHSIALGMGGTIEQKLEHVLAELGVVSSRAKQTLQTLNTHAGNSLHAIWRTRQHALHEKGVLYRAQGQGVTLPPPHPFLVGGAATATPPPP